MSVRFVPGATGKLIIEMDDEMSFALADLVLQALVQWQDLAPDAFERLGKWGREIRALRINLSAGASVETEHRWSATRRLGWIGVSRVLLRSYAEWGLSPDEVLLLIHIIDRQWANHDPFSKLGELASSMGRHEKSVRAYLQHLRELGFLGPTYRFGKTSVHDVSPLFAKLDAATQAVAATIQNPSLPSQNFPVPPQNLPLAGTAGTTSTTSTPSSSAETLRGSRIAVEEALAAGRRKADEGAARADARVAARRERATANPPQESGEQGGREKGKEVKGARDEKPVESFNCNDIEREFRHAWSEKWPNVTPTRWSGRDRKNVKDMIEELGAPLVVQVFQYVVRDWTNIVKEYGLSGYPAVPVIYGFRSSLVPQAQNGRVRALGNESHSAQWRGDTGPKKGKNTASAKSAGGWDDLDE